MTTTVVLLGGASPAASLTGVATTGLGWLFGALVWREMALFFFWWDPHAAY